MKKTEINKLLHDIYYDPENPGSFGGVSRLLTQANQLLLQSGQPKIRRDVVEEWTRNSETFGTHRPSSNKFERNPVKVNFVNEIWQVDTIFYPDLASYNKGFAYVFAKLDSGSRFMHIRFMKKKTCLESVNALKEIIKQAGVKPKFIMADFGTEFYCKPMFDFLKSQDIKLYSKKSGDVKTPHLDRATLTIQNKLHRIFDEFHTRDILTNLPKVVHSYNNSVNRSIGMTPAEALVPGKWSPQIDKRQQQMHPMEKIKAKVGQFVRLLGQKQGHHAYKGDWTFEVFKISRVKQKEGRRPQYYVKDLTGEPVLGALYANEIQLVKKPSSVKEYKIERIIKYRTFKGKRQALVKWLKLDKSQNSWINVNKITDL
jgi:hypothetical protein